MSTKITLKTADQRDGSPGFHLYHDAVHQMDDHAVGNGPFYLRLEGVQVHLETLDRGGAVVTIAIPEETAKELGLI
jgi:hypothetical protein